MIKNRLKQIRHELQIDTQKQMAELLGISKGQYNRYERQEIQPTLDTAFRISRILEKPIEQLFDYKPD